MRRASVPLGFGWISLAIIGIAIFVFGLVAAMVPAPSGPTYLRADGVASIGMGLFGLLSSGRRTSRAICRPAKTTSTK